MCIEKCLPKLIPRFDSWKRDSQFKKLRECRSKILKAEDTDRKSITVNEQMQKIDHDIVSNNGKYSQCILILCVQLHDFTKSRILNKDHIRGQHHELASAILKLIRSIWKGSDE